MTELKAACAPLPSAWSRTAPSLGLSHRVYRARSALAIMALVGMCQPCNAQSPDQAKAGHVLAETLCVTCHRVGANDRDSARTPPDFGAVADMPSMTEVSLRVFLRTPHGDMPRYQFSPSEMGDLIAYLQSLRSR